MSWTLNLILNSRLQAGIYKADSEPKILYMTTFTTHLVQMIVLFSSKKSTKLGHLIQSAGTGAFGPKAL